MYLYRTAVFDVALPQKFRGARTTIRLQSIDGSYSNCALRTCSRSLIEPYGFEFQAERFNQSVTVPRGRSGGGVANPDRACIMSDFASLVTLEHSY